MIRYINKLKEESGFTLLETVIALAITFIGVLASYSAVQMGQKFIRHGEAVTEVQQEAAIALRRIERKVRETAATEVLVRTSEYVWETTGEAGGDVLAFPSPRDHENRFHLKSGNARPSWQKPVIYYYYMYTDGSGDEHFELREYIGPVGSWPDNVETLLYLIEDVISAPPEEQLGTPIVRELDPMAEETDRVNFRWEASSQDLLRVKITTGAQTGMGDGISTALSAGIKLRN
jgi:type II secretory pathway pseudopilin PulG